MLQEKNKNRSFASKKQRISFLNFAMLVDGKKKTQKKKISKSRKEKEIAISGKVKEKQSTRLRVVKKFSCFG